MDSALDYFNVTANNFSPISSKSDTHRLQELLLYIGFPPNLYGYSYIVYAMELIIQNPDNMHHVTKGLYIDVAKHFNTTPERVERAIRHSINATWAYGNKELLNTMFYNYIKPNKGVPTNSLLLARLYYYIKNMENVK